MTRPDIDTEPFTIGYLFKVVKCNSIGNMGAETFLNTLAWALAPLLPEFANPTIDKNTAYLIRDRKGEFITEIKIATDSEESVALLAKFYKEQILPKLPMEIRSDVKYQLSQAFQADPLIDPHKKEIFQKSFDTEPMEEALARITRYLMARKNCINSPTAPMHSFHKKKLPFLSPIPLLPLPTMIQKRELQVVRALLLVYGEYDHSSYSMEQIGHLAEWDMHLMMQRQVFQTVFVLREQMRQLITPELPRPFEHLCDEMLAGILSTYMKPHPNGYHCLCDVLDKAILIPLDTVSAVQQTRWIGINQRIGLCHYLIYKKKLPGWIPPVVPSPFQSVS